MKTRNRRILIAVTGISPAILTETVWALAQRDEPWLPDQVIAVTTRTGKWASSARKKLRSLFSQPELVNMLIPPMKGPPGSSYPADKIEVLLK
jgi:hypothetical protein